MPEYRKISVKSPSISAENSYHHKGRVLVKVLAQIFEDLDLDHRRVAVLWDVPHHLDRHPAILLRAGVSARRVIRHSGRRPVDPSCPFLVHAF